MQTVEVSKVVKRAKRNNIGQYFVEVEYFDPNKTKYNKRGRILFFKNKKDAKKVIVGYKITM